MGRRSLHSSEELRQLILTSAREIVERDGYAALSARAIAKAIGYSPGTLYNIFKNLDDLLLTLEISLLDDAVENLRAAAATTSGVPRVRALAQRYLDFSLRNRRLWNLLYRQRAGRGEPEPNAVQFRFEAMAAIFKDAVLHVCTGSCHEAEKAAHTLWLGLQGMSALAVGERLNAEQITLLPECALILVDGILAGHEP